MKTDVGIWIDREKAIIVSVTADEVTSVTVESGLERHTRLSGGHRTASPYGAKQIVSEQKRDRRHEEHLRAYYREVIERIGGASGVYILGPGEAKLGLRRTMQESKALSKMIAAVETADKMTDRQLHAKVRQFFLDRDEQGSRP